MFSYLTADNVFDRYTKAKTYTDSLTEPFPEFERIARNRPHDDIDPNYPRTTDGTSASIIRKTPKRVVQQLPTGVVSSDDKDDWLPIVADDIYRNKILPCANEEYDLIQKCWTMIEKALTFGASASYAPFLNHDGYLSPDCTVIHWGNVVIPKGKKSGYALPYFFMESWWQKEDIEALIEQQNGLDKNVEKTWDTTNLKQLLEAISEKDAHQKTASESDRGLDASGILLVTGFQKGVKAKYFTFSPTKKLVARTKVNKDPRGKYPIDWMYGDIDGTNPLGRGIIELIGGLQNLIDSDMQMYQYNRALMLDPPLMKRGSMRKSAVHYGIHQITDLGTDPTNSVEALKVDTTALVNYPQLYGLQKSQLLNLVSSPDTSISAEIGNPGFGKTPTAINSQQATISVDDNFIRKMFESWFQHWSETAVNLWFAERTGVDELDIDETTLAKLEKLAKEDKFDLSLIQDGKLRINYDDTTPALKFRVDASTSKMKDDNKQLEALNGLVQVLDTSPWMQQLVPKEKQLEVWNRLVSVSSVEDPEDLIISEEDIQNMQAAEQQQQMQQQAMQMQAQPAPVDQPQRPQAPAPNPLDQQVAMELQKLGATPVQIQQAIGMLDAGRPAEDVLRMFAGAANGR